jgi:hypothetical protein
MQKRAMLSVSVNGGKRIKRFAHADAGWIIIQAPAFAALDILNSWNDSP